MNERESDEERVKERYVDQREGVRERESCERVGKRKICCQQNY